jgi:hypothetical protein
MPKVLDPHTLREREVSQATIDSWVEDGKTNFVFTPFLTGMVDDGKEGVRLWDNIDGQWTKPLPYMQRDAFLRKGIWKCSACQMTSSARGDIAAHVQNALESTQRHKRAKLRMETQRDRVVHLCTGCGSLFPMRRNMGPYHLEQAKAMGPAHKDAKEILMPRFSEAPGVWQPKP